MKTKTGIIIFALLTFISCREKPSYNPFDEQFNVSLQQLVKDGVDKNPVECGYYNWTKNTGRLRPFYQVLENELQVTAKGFQYFIDTSRLDVHCLDAVCDVQWNEKLKDSLALLPFDLKTMDEELKPFGYKVFKRDSFLLYLINEEILDTVSLEIVAYRQPGSRNAIRGISYYKPLPRDYEAPFTLQFFGSN